MAVLGSSSNHYAIIVAGGSGTRMGAPLPKQFLLLNGKPVMMHTIEAFHQSAACPNIIVVIHPDFHDYWKDLCTNFNFAIPHQLVGGGETRFHSVKNGLDAIVDNDEAIVAVHDAVRPLTSASIIEESFRLAALYGNAITAVKSRDSIRQQTGGVSKSLRRDEIYLVQTPQTFKLAQLKKAYQQSFDEGFTDDASVAEAAGYKIYLAEGSHQNIKITFPEDIAIAGLILKK